METPKKQLKKRQFRLFLLIILSPIILVVGVRLFRYAFFDEPLLPEETSNLFQQGPSNAEIESVVTNLVSEEPSRFGQYYGARLSYVTVLNKEKCPKVSGDEVRGIAEKWLVRVSMQFDGKPAKEEILRFEKVNNTWQIPDNVAVSNCVEWWE